MRGGWGLGGGKLGHDQAFPGRMLDHGTMGDLGLEIGRRIGAVCAARFAWRPEVAAAGAKSASAD